ncbi:D(2)-like dopamine receptor [Actinia tenebrosa]|uniref:D(2)-like dopamine receptor n=1 Tax=Actinia tenebrosa TaxID=6105 RepID=A0A6P8IKQ7_ACTTE|nr:D(2)-like dopamine receptor [Actinia tenebrosa]
MVALPPALICLVVFNILISVLGTFGNALVLLAVVKNRSLQTVPDLFIFSMAVADLIVTGVQQPMLTCRVYRINSPNLTFNSILETIGFLAILASITSMFMVTIDRFVAIQRPFVYIRLATSKRAVQVISTLWILCPTFTVSSHFIQGQEKYYAVWTYMTILLLSTVIIYVYLFYTARKQQNKIIMANTLGTSVRSNDHTQKGIPLRTRQRNERKPAKTIAIVVGVFIVFWTPFLAYVITNADILEKEELDKMIWFYWFLSLSLCNSTLNPYIYCVRNSRYRLAFAKLLHLKRVIQLDSSQVQSYARPTNANVIEQQEGELQKRRGVKGTVEVIEIQ